MLKRRLFLITLLLLLATAARLVNIQAQSIWFDEGWSAHAAEQPTLLAAWNADATNPPFYYVLLYGMARVFGTSEFALRYVSLLLGLVTIPLVYHLARQSANERGGIYAALLAAISAPLWWASQEARMYTLLALLVLICALAWERVVNRPSSKAWVALWMAELLLLYSHNTGPVAIIWLNLITLLVWIKIRRPHRRRWVLSQFALGLIWLPYFISRFLLLPSANSAITNAPQVGLPLLWQIWQGMWIAPWSLANAQFPLLTLLSGVVLLVSVALVALLVLLRRARWLMLHLIILTSGLIAGLMVLGNELHGRYLVMVVPLLLALLGAGLSRLRIRWTRLVAVSPFAFLFAVCWFAVRDPLYQHDEVRGMVRFYADNLTVDDSVIAWSYADRYDLAYYWERMGVQAQRVTLPEGADLNAVLPLLPTSGDVALNVWYTQRADYRGMMGCILAHGTANEPETFTTYGMTTLIFDDPALDLPQPEALDVTFSDAQNNPAARLSTAGAVPETTAERGLCLPLQITLLRDLDADLKAAVMVENDLGWTVASADVIFASANQRTSASLGAGETLAAYPLLRLPYGAPAGEYRIWLRLYDQTAAPAGYVPPSSAQAVGHDLLLGTWMVQAGADWAAVRHNSEPPSALNLPPLGDLRLLADNLPGEANNVVANGEEIRLALLWEGQGRLPPVELADEAGAWTVEVPSRLNEQDGIRLDWRSVRVPASATSGTAALRFSDGTILARYLVEALPMQTDAPPFEQAVGMQFPGVGELVGYSLNDAPFSAENPPDVTLIWQAGEETPALSYTVTTQLVDQAGQVIAQSDAIPGARPMTGWRTGEFIVDEHRLTFNGVAATGEVRLIVGVYDAQTGERVRLDDGADAVILMADAAVE